MDSQKPIVMRPPAYDISTLPPTLRWPLQAALEQDTAGHHRDALSHLLDFAEMAVMYAGHVLLALLQSRLDHLSPEAMEVLRQHVRTIDTKRPASFGVWVNDLFVPLLRAAVVELPEHELVDAMGAALLRGRKKLKTCVLNGVGSTPDVVKIRNQYRGHGMSLSQTMASQAIAMLEDYTTRLLDALRPLAGAQIENAAGHYLLTIAGETLDLYPLVHYDGAGAPYVFQTLLANDKMQCVSSHENADLMATTALNDAFDACMQQLLPSFDIARDMSWGEMKEHMRAETQRFLDRIYKEKKYNRELFVERRQLTASLHAFWASDATLFPLVGEAGQGKTNQLCYWAEECLRQDRAVLIFNSADFSARPLDLYLKDVMGVAPQKDIMRVLRAIDDKAASHGEQVCVFFDAINECLHYASSRYSITAGNEEGEAPAQADNGPLLLYRAIAQVLAAPELSHIKVLMTCRTFTWKNLLLPAIDKNDARVYHGDDAGDQPGVSGFTDDEAREAYDIYRRLFQMRTDFDRLQRGVAIRLKDPLILKYVCTDYQGQPLVSDMARYTSVALFGKMIDDIANAYAGRQQAQVIDALADVFLDSYLAGEAMDGIAIDDMRRAPAGTPLHALARLMLKDDGISIAYAELLSKVERPVLRETVKDRDGEDVPHVQFIYERFLEYVMGRRFAQRHGSDTALIAPTVFIHSMSHAAMNVVMVGAMRHALIIDYLRHGDAATILALAAHHSTDYRVMSLVTETIDTLVRENFEDDLFALMESMLDFMPQGSGEHIARYNELNRLLAANQATPEVIAEHRQLTTALTPLIRLRDIATVSVVGGMLLTDFFNEGLYGRDALQLVWRLMADDLNDTRDNTCKSVYYLSNRRRTLGGTPLRENLTWRIAREMYARLMRHGLVMTVARKPLRKRAPIYVEAATRLIVLLIIDKLLAGERADDNIPPVSDLLDAMRRLLAHFTWNFRLVRMVMPVIQVAMRKQITFQSDYVNNAIEYQGYWDDTVVPSTASDGKWSRERMTQCIRFIDFYEQYGHRAVDDPERVAALSRLDNLRDAILDAYTTGDSLSYFVLERLLIVVGTDNWPWLAPLMERLLGDDYRRSEWHDYTQMSLLYTLLHVQSHSHDYVDALTALYERESEDWTRRCRGLFKARNSHKANPRGVYKRNVLVWYAVVYTARHGDGVAHPGHERPVPMIYRLIDEAVATGDKELLYHIIENISEMIADFGLVETGLQLLKAIMRHYDSDDKVARIDAIDCSQRGGIYRTTLVSAVGNVLSTAKNYFPAQVDLYIRSDLSGLKFPGVPTYRDSILNYSPSGEGLADLFTHKFGKFVIWSLLHERAVDDFVRDAIAGTLTSKDCFSWFAQVVRLGMNRMFDVKV